MIDWWGCTHWYRALCYMRRVGTVTNIFTQKRLYFLPKLPRHQGACGGNNPCFVTLVQQAVYFIRFHLQIELQFQQMAKTFMANISHFPSKHHLWSQFQEFNCRRQTATAAFVKYIFCPIQETKTSQHWQNEKSHKAAVAFHHSMAERCN